MGINVGDPPLLALGAEEIHLWLAFHDDHGDPELHGAYRRLLDGAEMAQESRFHFAKDRVRYLVTRALVRTVLSRYVPVAPADWVFSVNAYGRPAIVNAAAIAAGLQFNLSHAPNLIVLGVAVRRALGVDVENLARRAAPIEVADRYFAAQEVADLAAVAPDERQYRFFEYWTFKESYIKARGMGLSLPLDQFGFHYADDFSVALSIDPVLADDPTRWQFWQFQPAAEYLVAVCAERTTPAARLLARRIVPMVSDAEMLLRPLRISHAGVAIECH